MNDDLELDTRYVSAMDDERAAWYQLQAQPPGTQARAQAWTRWSEAIARTNTAWRQLSGAQRSTQHNPLHAQPQHPVC